VPVYVSASAPRDKGVLADLSLSRRFASSVSRGKAVHWWMWPADDVERNDRVRILRSLRGR
jgi:hypothetical protein